MDEDKKPTKIVVDPKRVEVLPSEAGVEHEEEVKHEAKDQGHLHVLSKSWFARILCLIFFILSLLGLAFSFVIFLVCLLNALIRLFTNDPDWADTLKTFASGLLSGLVFTFCFLVGIFSPSWALFMGIAYTSLAKK